MIAPAVIASPPYALTPSRFECESRPLRELPPAFLCAIYLPRTDASADDAVDLQLGVSLTMTLMLLVVLAASHLEDLDLVAAPMRKHCRVDRCSGQRRLAQPDAVTVADHQNLVE